MRKLVALLVGIALLVPTAALAQGPEGVDVSSDDVIVESGGQAYESYLAANCTKSPQLQTVRRYRGVRERAEDLHKELDKLVKDVTQTRSVRITIE